MNTDSSDTAFLWRSLLFVPAHSERFVGKAPTAGADAIILDLEDSVPEDSKESARAVLPGAIESISRAGLDVLVRVNSRLRHLAADLEAAMQPALAGIVLPKAESGGQVQMIEELMRELEGERSLSQCSILAQIESPQGFRAMDDIASQQRVRGMALGSEDFSVACGMQPSPETLSGPSQALVFAARRHECIPYGFPASISELDDMVNFETHINRARHMGFCGGLAIHPRQVEVMNRGYLPDVNELEAARKICAAATMAARDGKAAFALDGKMIDPPVVLRARQLIAFADR